MELQRGHGNAAVSRMMARRLLQRSEYGEGEFGRRPNLVQGDTGAGVTLLQRLLGVKESGVFDGATRAAVDRFQSQCGWAPSGVGPMSWDYLERHEGAIGARPNLSAGDRGPGVKLLQKLLGVAQTSLFDQTTRKAVDAFQRRQGWEPSGVGPQTWAKLDALGVQGKSFDLESNPDGSMSLDADPRKSSRYIDNRVEAVGWGLYVGVLDGEIGSFLVWCSGLSDPIRLPWKYTSFDTGPRTPVGKEGHGDAFYDSHKQAAAAAPDLGHEVAFFPTAGGMTAPTIFSPMTAPRVMQSAKTAFEQVISQVEEELIIVAISLVGMIAGRIAYSRVNRIGKGGAPKPKAGEEPPPPKQQEGPGPAVPRAGRPRLTVAQIRALNPYEYVTFRTRDEAVAREATLEPRGMANPLVKDDVCFQDGLEGLNYGEWHVSFKKGEVPGLREAGPSFPGEWRTAEPVAPDKGVWYHHDDWKAAKGK
jgi:peptidoglycan hydrolase-like protein with peptidoglycan-binding domain